MDQNTWDFIQSVKEGDTNAYERMYLMYKDKIYALALSTLKNRQDAEDATQQTFITVYEKLHTLQDNAAFNTWIQRIAINESNMILRKRRGDISIDDDTNGSLAEKVEDELMLPQDYLEREDLSRRLREIIDELPAVQRQALVLQMYSDMTMAEIAQVMGCSQNTVKSRIRYAKAYIRTEIEERERKSGEKFYGAVFLPFGTMFVHLVQQQSMSAAVAAKIWAAVSAKIAAAAAAGAGAGAAAGAKAGAAAGAKAGMSVGAKVAIGALAGAVVIGGGVFGVTQILAANDDKPAPEESQEAIVDTVTGIPTVAATEALTQAPTEKDYTPVYSSYLEALEEKETQIRNYYWVHMSVDGDSDPKAVSFEDLDGDGTPEMIYLFVTELQDGGKYKRGFADLFIDSYRDGKVKTLYQIENWDQNVAGGVPASVLFRTDSGIYSGEYGTHKESYTQLTCNGSEISGKKLAEKTVEGSSIFSVSQAVGADPTRILLATSYDGEERTRDLFGIDHSVENISMTYDEAIAYLKGKIDTTAQAETAASDSGDAEGSKILKAAAKDYMVPANSYYRMYLIISADGTIRYRAEDHTAAGVGATSDSHATLTFDKKLTEYSYAYSVSDYALDEGSDDYLSGVTSITIYTPETPVSALPEYLVSWLNLSEQERLDRYLVIDSNDTYFI